MTCPVHLRKPEIKDIPGMLEWMHDPELNRWFRFNAEEMTEGKAQRFIENAFSDTSMHYAVADEADIYLGTISLEDIDRKNGHALYAVAMRKCAQGTGAAMAATKKLLNIAFTEMGLERVYLNVLSDNIRAKRFYEKAGFTHEGCFRRHLKLRNEWRDWDWYAILKDEFNAGNDRSESAEF